MPATQYRRTDITFTGRLAEGSAHFELDGKPLFSPRSKVLAAAAARTYGVPDMQRLAIRMDAPELVEIDWESELAAAAHGRVLAVRLSDVHPRATQRLFDFPARILALGNGARITDALSTLLDERSEYAMVAMATTTAKAERAIEKAEWPVVDIIHFTTEAHLLLKRTRADDTGSLRWLMRRCDRWNPRVIILEGTENDLGRLRQIGQRVVDCGGPAVFVVDQKKINVTDFYAGLLHDVPLDLIAYELGGTLFAGAGREDAIRFSSVARHLLDERVQHALRFGSRQAAPAARAIPRDAAKSIRPIVRKAVRDSARIVNLGVSKKVILPGQPWQKYMRFGDVVTGKLVDCGYLVRPLGEECEGMSLDMVAEQVESRALPIEYVLDPETEPQIETYINDILHDVRQSEQRYVFDFREGEGTLPLAAKSTTLRKIVQAAEPRAMPPVQASTEETPAERHVNTRFYRENGGAELVEIEQRDARLKQGEIVHLGIRIGQKDKLLETYGELIFADEGIHWTPEMTGTWIEVALTPIDFENLGEPVQEFWLPRTGDAKLITFAVRPMAKTTIPGVARLRFTFYHRNNVLQSFRVAALLGEVEDGTAGLSAALDGDPSRMGDSRAGYLTRIEYSAVDPVHAASAPERSLSIVANESAGEKIFSVKGEDFFSTTIDDNVATHVKDARAELLKSSKTAIDEYLYGDDNSGDEEKLCERLFPLAREGWGLYFSILKDSAQQAKAKELLGSGGTIHAAHIKLKQLITWPLIYDRAVDANLLTWYDKESDTDLDVDRAVCLAAKPDAEGTMPPGDCITDAKCILSPQALRDYRTKHPGHMLHEKTVICPRRFWGFMHQIEVPAQQAAPGDVTKALPDVVEAAKPIGIVAGFNPNVRHSKEHLPALQTAMSKLKDVTILAAYDRRSRIMQSLDDYDPDVVYFYCHGYPDSVEKTVDPNLDFGQRVVGDFVRPDELAGKTWGHAPLVFLNACGSIGFSNEAPAEFITAFVQSRLAAAVVGTEVTVWPELATEMALYFLNDFLTRKSAGEALLRARRMLLAKFNPLGLVYTLYGSNNLHLK